MFIVFRALLLLIHFLCDLFTAIHNFGATLHRKCMEAWYGENLRIEVEILIRSTAKLKQIPKHIVVVFGAKEDTFIDCIKLIGWCVTLGIPYISFFDINGFLVKNESFLKYEIAKRRPDLVEHVSWSKPITGYTQNGISGNKSKTLVSLLSPLDGKGAIVNLTKKLADAVTAGTIKMEEVNISLLDEKLHSRGIPDPDMGLIYGRCCSTYGVLPWHIRITEFYTLPLQSSLSARDFAYLLKKYSKCEQRHGK